MTSDDKNQDDIGNENEPDLDEKDDIPQIQNTVRKLFDF